MELPYNREDNTPLKLYIVPNKNTLQRMSYLFLSRWLVGFHRVLKTLQDVSSCQNLMLRPHC